MLKMEKTADLPNEQAKKKLPLVGQLPVVKIGC
jgi:hypothetical protein